MWVWIFVSVPLLPAPTLVLSANMSGLSVGGVWFVSRWGVFLIVGFVMWAWDWGWWFCSMLKVIHKGCMVARIFPLYTVQ